MNELPLHWSVDTAPLAHAAVFSFEARPAELEALKRYAGIEDLTVFRAEVKVSPIAGGRFKVSGTLRASLVQASVIDLAPVRSSLEENFSVQYWPAGSIEDAAGDTVPLDAESPEPLDEGGHIAVGAFLSELFAVSIDPYPRNEGDTFEWTPPEPEASPFASLAHLKVQKSPDSE
ncbi:MAG: hypothetical protein ACLPPF_02910 [Rhodomicrobium sp.]